MRTQIFTTKKLGKLIKKLIQTNPGEACGNLGNWNATVFYVSRKKCWLVTNKKTKYNVVLANIKSSDLDRIEEIFKNAFYSQLVYDGIITDFKYLDSIIGSLEFLPTDNDKSTTGFQNQRLQSFEWWKYDFPTLEDMPLKELANRTNTIPIHIGKGRKMSDYTYSRNEMEKLLME